MRKSLRTLIIAVAALIMMLCLSSVAFADSTELTITNNTNMFKAVTASLETDGASETLVVALSGSGYHELFKGTYGEALRNGANEDNWIHGAVNKDEKWEFRIPLEKDESYVPVVAISNSYYEKYKQGQNPIERAFYPRQMEIDRTAKTLVTGDYDAVIELEIDNDIKMFKPGAKADLHVIGGPNSNDHKLLLTLYTDSTSITKFKSGETEIEKEPEENPFGGYTFKDIPVEVQKGAILGSWSAKNSKYYDRPYYINMQERKLYFRDAATTVEEFYGLSESEARVLAAVSATPKLCGQLIDAIYVQKRTDDTDALCAAAKACWDNLSDEDKEKVEGEDADPDYFGRDTGDASKDDPLNQDEIGDNELLVVSFGTSFNESRAEDIGGIEKALAKANPGWDVRRAFTAQIIINHVQARDGERIDNMKQALDRAVANEVKNLVVQPTHLMHGAEYDELVEELGKYENKFESVKIAEPLLGPVGETEEEINEDKKAVAEAAVAAAVEKAGYDSAAAMAEDKVALVFMGHGTSHEAKKTYPQMQAQMKELGFDNVFIGTVEGKPESTALPAVKKAIENAGYTKVILRPLMVVAGDHANNDMADPEDEGSWYHAFVNGGMYEVEGSDEPVDIGPGFGEENVTCQIEGLGRITAVQLVYMIHTDAAIASRVADLIDAIYVQKWTVNTEAQCKAAKDAWDALTDTQKELVEGEEASPDYFGRDTGDAKKDDPLNQDNIGEKELLVVSFGTSFNDSRAEDIGGIEKALAKANPGWAVRRAFTAQIIINHVLARDGEKIDNVKQALDRAVANGVKELVVQPTHLMHGAEYDELVEELATYQTKIEKISVAEPLLGPVGATEEEINEDKKAVAEAAVAEAVKVSGYESIDAMAQAKTALVFMGHGTSHEAKKTYTQMQAQMKELGFNNVFIGTVEGKPESTALPAVKKAVEDAGYTRVILRPLMVVAGDHANNDMADLEDEGSWAHGFVYGGEFEVEGTDKPVDIGEGFGEDNVKCQIEGLGRIAAVQDLYVAHSAEFTADAEKKEAEEEAAKAVEEAEAIDKTKYTEANAAAVQKAIDDLKMILADPMSTTAQIKAAQNALAQAIKKAEDEKIEPIGKLKNNTIKASGKTVKVKASKKKTTFKKAKAFSVKKAVGKVTFKKKSGNKKVTVSKAGKVTVKKGLKKGKTYKIKVKVTAAGNHMYKSKTVTVTLKVKVTK